MTRSFQTLSPADGSVITERPWAEPDDLEAVLSAAVAAALDWRVTLLSERIPIVEAAMQWLEARQETLAEELTQQMGRPIRYSAGEIRGTADRARTMSALAPAALADITPPAKEGFTRFIRRVPLGVVLVLSPWNYPWLTAVNAIVPALLSGNVVILKHSDQTPLVAERFVEAFTAAGLPAGVFQFIHMDHDLTASAVADERVDFVAFTGSLAGGEAVHRAAGGSLKAMGLELGGKDPAYVRQDADLAFAIENVVDGAFFNSGQSCCAVERVYVHQDLFDEFVTGVVALVEQYTLGDPQDAATTLGPLVRPRNAAAVQAQIDAALAAGARQLVDTSRFSCPNGAYLPPQILVDVDHTMAIMTDETFGPVVGIMAVSGDAEAIALMNDSQFGLTASIWTGDEDAALAIGSALATGTVFMNRCDYLDPELAWVGVKGSGRGCTLSSVGFESLTRPKSFHLRSRP
ncbi:MAG: acyl-CoA reductase-like NAD-dependent aldehyde dehydrogenase [Myxococcota bacterium]|jgi:acyl-CoA reductase-like NAD-dependent aldehyde dehydrogenase